MSTDFMLTVQPDPQMLVFVLGAQSRRVSIHTQQLRAAKLGAQLASDAMFSSARNAAIVGAGAAGMTLALALAAQGKMVSLFEKSSRLIPLQYYNHTRYVHPFSVNWPNKDFSPSSELPFMNWYADYSSPVARKLYEKYYGLKRAMNLDITEQRNAAVKSCRLTRGSANAQSFSIEWGSNEIGTFDAVFFTEGFGLERKLSAFDNFSYWEDTSMLPRRTFNVQPRVAIIGDGDGALIDAARCIFQYRDLERIHDEIANSLTTREFRRYVSNVERQMAFDRHTTFTSEYVERFTTAVCKPEVDQSLRRFEESECHITLISESEHGLSPSSSPINKFLFLFLKHKRPNKFTYIRARAGSVSARAIGNTDMFSYTVTPARDHRFQSKAYLHQKALQGFDRVLERIGPGPYNTNLIKDLFDASRIADFIKRNDQSSDTANPSGLEKWEVDVLRDYFSEAAWVSEGSNDLVEYIQMITGGEIDKAKSQVGYNVGHRTFEVDGVVLPKTIEPKQLAGKGGRSRIDNLPRAWYGTKLRTDNIKREDLRKDRDVYGFIANAQFGLDVTEPLSNTIMSGQRVRLCDPDLPCPPDGKIAYYVKNASSAEGGSSGEVYALVPRHVVQNVKSHSVICAIGSGSEPRQIGEYREAEFGEKILAETRRGTFSCLGDIALIRIRADQSVENCTPGLDLKSPFPVYEAAVDHPGIVYSGLLPLGKITKVFNHTSVNFPFGDPVPVETFVIESESEADANAILSGSVVNMEDGRVLGMVIGSKGREILCVESVKIHAKLELDLV